MDQPYSGLRIIDLGGELSAYASRLFANLGAEVIMVELPGGRSDRHLPSPSLVPGYGGAEFAFTNAGKQSVTIDWASPKGWIVLEKILKRSEIVFLESDAIELLPKILGVPGGRIITATSHFGLKGPYQAYAGNDLVAQAMGGLAWLSGTPGLPPLKVPAEQTRFITSAYAAAATAIALWDLEMKGQGHVIDVSAQECVAHSLQNAPQVWDLEHKVLSRGGEGIRDATEDVFACRGGYVFLAAALSLPASWNGIVDWMMREGHPGADRLLEADWQDRGLRATAPMKLEFKELFEGFLADKHRSEVLEVALRRKIAMAPVSDISDIPNDPQLLFRDFFVDLPHPAFGRSVRFPGAPYRFSEPVWRITHAAPRIGEHNTQILSASDEAARRAYDAS